MSKTKTILLIVTVVVLVCAVVLCTASILFLKNVRLNKPFVDFDAPSYSYTPVTPIPSPTPTISKNIPSAELAEYSNQQIGFSFTYPRNLQLSETKRYVEKSDPINDIYPANIWTVSINIQSTCTLNIAVPSTEGVLSTLSASKKFVGMLGNQEVYRASYPLLGETLNEYFMLDASKFPVRPHFGTKIQNMTIVTRCSSAEELMLFDKIVTSIQVL